MKTKRNIYSFLTASLALLVTSPGRFSYGITLLFIPWTASGKEPWTG